MVSKSDDEGEIVLYGDVRSQQPIDWWTGEPRPGFYITPEGFMEDLEQVKNKSRITVKLNSCGGDLYTGIAIHNALKALSGSIEVVVDGIAASAASVIMCAGDTVKVYPGSLVMIHGVSVSLWDSLNIPDMEQLIKSMDASERAVAELYHAKTGIDTDQLRSMMTDETWMTGKEAVETGFADELLDGEVDVSLSADKKVLMVNGIGHESGDWQNIPFDRIRAKAGKEAVRPSASLPCKPDNPINQTNTSQGGNKNVTLEELRKEHPDLANEIDNQIQQAKAEAEKQAAACERERLQEIESIQGAIADPELIQEAKFGEKACTAEQLSFRAMQKHAQMGTTFLSQRKEELEESGAAKVANLPPADDGKMGKATTPEDVASVVGAYMKSKGVQK